MKEFVGKAVVKPHKSPMDCGGGSASGFPILSTVASTPAPSVLCQRERSF